MPSSLEACLNELHQFELFKELSKEELAKLCDGGNPSVFYHQDKVFEAGDRADFFGVVLSGAFKLSRTSPTGESVIVHFALPGEVIAAFIMAQPNPVFPLTTQAMGPSRFLKIPRESFLNHWKKNPELLLKVQSSLSKRMHQLQEDKVMAKSSLSRRLAFNLLKLLDKSPHQSDGLIPIALTRRELAETLGSTVESIIRIMSDWSKKGILSTTDQQIKILKVEKLIEQLEEDPQS